MEIDLAMLDSTPDERIFGLSSRDFVALTHFPFSPFCPIQLQTGIDDRTLDQIPFFRLCEDLMEIIADSGELTLTKLGNLPVKTVRELYHRNPIKDRFLEARNITQIRESDVPSIIVARNVCTLAGLVKKRHNKLSLTQKGKLLPSNRADFSQLIFKTHCLEYDASELDGYPDQATGQVGLLVIWYLLIKYGEIERPTEFYAMKYLALFPDLMAAFKGRVPQPVQSFIFCFEFRAFFQLTDWWNFTQTTEKKWGDPNTVRSLQGLHQFLSFQR